MELIFSLQNLLKQFLVPHVSCGLIISAPEDLKFISIIYLKNMSMWFHLDCNQIVIIHISILKIHREYNVRMWDG
jgi:hypothetical protein